MAKKTQSKKRKKNQTKSPNAAKLADLHRLYERSVQNPEADIEFIDKTYRKLRRKSPRVLREDFCGTALMCKTWVEGKRQREAIGVDLDEPTLEWATENNISSLGKKSDRVQLVREDVRTVRTRAADVAVAFNFSYCIFKERPALIDYFANVKANLSASGLFFLDAHGGTELREEICEEQDFDDFTYVWEQTPVCPIRSEGVRYIHFKFPDGSKIKRAFVYDWRLWSLTELGECLREAGFENVRFYWEGATRDGDGDGDFQEVGGASEEPSWVAYLVAD